MSSQSRCKQSGLSVVELMIVIGITLALLVGVGSFLKNVWNVVSDMAERENADSDYEAVAKQIIQALEKADTSSIKLDDCKEISGERYCEKMTFDSTFNSRTPYKVEVSSICHLKDMTATETRIKQAKCTARRCTGRTFITVTGKNGEKKHPPAGSTALGMFLCMQQEFNRYRFTYLAAHKASVEGGGKTGRAFSVDLFKLEGPAVQNYYRK